MKSLSILLYHRVGPAVAGTHPELTVQPEHFRAQMEWLARKKYQTVTTEELRAGGIAGLTPRSVMLTFDDGYADLAQHVFPLLRQHGFSAVVFFPTAFLGKFNEWDRTEGSAALPLFSAEQILNWSGQGIEFGSHGCAHCDLTALNDDDLVREIRGSKEALGAVIGRPVHAFAYPYGKYDERSLAQARTDYRFAFTAVDGLNCAEANPHLLRRTMVQPTDNILGFALRVRRGGNPIQRVRASAAKARRLVRDVLP